MMMAMLLAALLNVREISSIDSTVGFAAVNLANGRHVELRENEPFPMGSVYKLPIGIAVLYEVDAGRLQLSQRVTIKPGQFAPAHSPIRDAAHGKAVTLTIEELVDALVRDSDNTACDTLLRIVTPAAVTARIRAMGVTGLRVDRPETMIAKDIAAGGVAAYAADPRDTCTPAAAVALLTTMARGQDGLSVASHNRLLRLMREGPRNRIKVRLPANAVVAHKSGQMPGTRNDIGIVTLPDRRTQIVIAIFTKAGTRSTDDQRAEVISAIARRVYESLTGSAESSSRPRVRSSTDLQRRASRR